MFRAILAGVGVSTSRTPICGTNGEEKKMKRFLSALSSMAALVAVILVFSPATYAANPEDKCEIGTGCTYTAAGPESTCDCPGDQLGQSDNTRGGSSTSGPGSSDPNSTPTVCTGVSNPAHPCP
jgi:hypothetical protein